MPEKFESRENEEDAVDLLSSLTRELAESKEDINLAQMVKMPKIFGREGSTSPLTGS